MRTTLDLPERLLKCLKQRAVQEGRSLKDIVAQTIAAELAATTPARSAKWKVPVAPHDMGWNGLNWDEIKQVMAAEMDEALRHRAGNVAPGKRHGSALTRTSSSLPRRPPHPRTIGRGAGWNHWAGGEMWRCRS